MKSQRLNVALMCFGFHLLGIALGMEITKRIDAGIPATEQKTAEERRITKFFRWIMEKE